MGASAINIGWDQGVRNGNNEKGVIYKPIVHYYKTRKPQLQDQNC